MIFFNGQYETRAVSTLTNETIPNPYLSRALQSIQLPQLVEVLRIRLPGYRVRLF